jgi:hypothetical protein
MHIAKKRRIKKNLAIVIYSLEQKY